MKYRITHLAGRARSGSDKVGNITHAVTQRSVALCGVKPGDRSAGWSEYNDQELTCPKCIRKVAELEPQCSCFEHAGDNDACPVHRSDCTCQDELPDGRGIACPRCKMVLKELYGEIPY